MFNHDRLKAVRIALRFSVQEMAHAFGMQGKNAADKIREYERNKRDLSGGQLIMLHHLERALMIDAHSTKAAKLIPRFIVFVDNDGNQAAMHTRYPRFYLLIIEGEPSITPIDGSVDIAEDLANEAIGFLKGRV